MARPAPAEVVDEIIAEARSVAGAALALLGAAVTTADEVRAGKADPVAVMMLTASRAALVADLRTLRLDLDVAASKVRVSE